jgi:four helix bundle protein
VKELTRVAAIGGDEHAGKGRGRWHASCVPFGMKHDIQERAFQMGLRVISLSSDEDYRRIVRWRVVGQLIDAATSVGSNLAEASAAQTKPDFISKVSISKKEAYETQFWLRLIDEGAVLGAVDLRELRDEAASVGRIVSTIVRRAKASGSRGEL